MAKLNGILKEFDSPIFPIERNYNVYTIIKNHKARVIEAPHEHLKNIQAALIPMFSQWDFHPACMSRKGFSAVDNANLHIDAKHVLRVDIKKCYPSITREHIEFAINKSPLRDDLKINFIEALMFCLYQKKGKQILPTGAPTSPILCNIALTVMDHEVSKLAKKAGYRYTRYIDDLHLSTTQDSRQWNLLNKISSIFSRYNFRVNRDKTKWLMPEKSDKTIITGVRLNGPCRIPRDFKRRLRAKLNNLARNKESIDDEAQGCLAYVKLLDINKYNYFIDYYNRRLNLDFKK